MPTSKDLGRLFALTIKVTAEAGWCWVAPTFEIEPPFRVCERCLILRVKPFRTALVLGWWRDSGLDEESALHRALSSRVVDLEEASELDQELRTVRDHIAREDLIPADWYVSEVADALGTELDELHWQQAIGVDNLTLDDVDRWADAHVRSEEALRGFDEERGA